MVTPRESPYSFAARHLGPRAPEVAAMLKALGYKSLDDLIDKAVPKNIRAKHALDVGPALAEHEATAKLRAMAKKNKINKSYIGMGYSDCVVPAVIQRNVLENPGWYTQYTPYQAEIAQGRLEALLNFQTMVVDLTGLPVANASLLDEATAAAEAMGLAFASRAKDASSVFFVDQNCHPQTISVVMTRAEPLGIEVAVGDPSKLNSKKDAPFGLLLQYPGTDGTITDWSKLIADARAAGTMVTVAADLMSLCLLKSPGDLGADMAVGNTQRFGVPMGYGGPHAAYFATRDEHKRKMPGRIIGMSKDVDGKPALRMALQTREQHIRRDKATSNICTSQVLLAIMASMYAVYHGPEGLKQIAGGIHQRAATLAAGLKQLGYALKSESFFDTLTVDVGRGQAGDILRAAYAKGLNLRTIDDETVGIAVDETTSISDLDDLLAVFAKGKGKTAPKAADIKAKTALPSGLARSTPFLTHPVFNTHHSETQMLRYIRSLEAKDLSLTRSMIPLGSCTMKLNATSELYPVSWPEFGKLHPFAPADQAQGYKELFTELERQLAECTGFKAVSLQPNSGAQGEYAGLLVIRKYHQSRGDQHRNICLIPKSAHGTNPASAVMAGMQVVVVACDDSGNIDMADLQAKADEHGKNLSCLMVTYPSTHGVFEETIVRVCEIVHKHGGQVYMDGANMNAQVGLTRPGEFGPDVCHLNLHKTFCIPHGGGGPGMGPIAVAAHLAPHLPGHSVTGLGGNQAAGAVSAAPHGSASILPISLMYIWMMGSDGLTEATKIAILNANYIAAKLHPHFPVLYRGNANLVAHECIVDLRQLKSKTGIEVEDVAKRLMDYGFHAPTVSFPVAGTLMIEPTESEALDELDRFCEAMIAIRAEIKTIEDGKADKENNVLKNAPHTAEMIAVDNWDKPYSRQQAVFPTPWVKAAKFWPPVRRVDGAYGDRNLVCTCAPIESYT
jgi:glycine dehydrogenase